MIGPFYPRNRLKVLRNTHSQEKKNNCEKRRTCLWHVTDMKEKQDIRETSVTWQDSLRRDSHQIMDHETHDHESLSDKNSWLDHLWHRLNRLDQTLYGRPFSSLLLLRETSFSDIPEYFSVRNTLRILDCIFASSNLVPSIDLVTRRTRHRQTFGTKDELYSLGNDVGSERENQRYSWRQSSTETQWQGSCGSFNRSSKRE